jgi:hypothetical protein
MINDFKEYLFLVVDHETKGVLTKCASASIANSVSKGIVNSSTMTIYFPYFRNKHNIINYQIDFSINYKLVRAHRLEYSNLQMPTSDVEMYEIVEKTNSGRTFDLIDFENVSEEWLEKRKLANYRSEKIRSLEIICERYMARLKEFAADEMFFQYLGTQLPLVNEEKNDYPYSILEWAEIRNVSPQSAFYELKMKYESTNISIMRIHAIWNKYVDKINSLLLNDSTESLIFSRLENELREGKK